MSKKLNLALIILSAFFLWQCKSSDIEERAENEMGPDSYSLNVMVIPGENYFRGEPFLTPDNSRDTVAEKYYSKLLFDAREIKFYKSAKGWERYRLIIEDKEKRSYVVFIDRQQSLYKIAWKELSPEQNDKPREVVNFKSMFLTIGEWNKLTRKIEKAKIWEIPTSSLEERQLDLLESSKKKSVWILEADKDGEYKAVRRFDPKKNSDYFELCEYILSLTDLDVKY